MNTQFCERPALAASPITADQLSEDAADRYFAHKAGLASPVGTANRYDSPTSSSNAPHPSGPSRAAARGLPAQIRYRSEILRAALAHGIDPIILAAVAAQETGGPGADSGRNIGGADGTGHGVFQIDSGTWGSWLAGHHNGMDVGENADKAAQILADNLRNTGGDLSRALHRYNAGSDHAVCTRTTWGDGTSLSYEDSVLRHAASIRKL